MAIIIIIIYVTIGTYIKSIQNMEIDEKNAIRKKKNTIKAKKLKKQNKNIKI